ncbi:MAG: alpha/beta fold hydrolase [Rhodobacter sp.]|nr:alpha/beta fold hydrolase [Rhodobacter sp.]
MAEVLLIHGSCHGAWCWHRVIPALAALGIPARAIDLPAHGQDRTPAADASLRAYAEAILSALTGPTLLVGHSAAGYAITAAAEMDPTFPRSEPPHPCHFSLPVLRRANGAGRLIVEITARLA